jgi:hypothetical protein
MKALEFESILTSQQTLSVPATVAAKIPQGQALRVLVLLRDDENEEQWEHLAAAEFGQGYADSDAIYDNLSTR